MDNITVFPDKSLSDGGNISAKFLSLGIKSFIEACRFVHALPYGYNTNRDDLMILFKENMGTCTTKHSVIATLAQELHLPIEKNVGIYAMTEEIVTGTNEILAKYDLPYVPMVHCFLAYGDHRVDLSEGNNNGKNRSIEEFLYTQRVEPNIFAKDEYLLYRKALKDHILTRKEMAGVDITQILHAREEGVKLLKRNIKQS
ncbi:MAG: hypothetical protein JSV17_11080 [Candidatus Aminicenantes bacterium]|nr:MAG: hypothetical protein JSV17_11080 [Candidatus Aminicenantes bacterium]